MIRFCLVQLFRKKTCLITTIYAWVTIIKYKLGSLNNKHLFPTAMEAGSSNLVSSEAST
jgi:hypothetical protein